MKKFFTLCVAAGMSLFSNAQVGDFKSIDFSRADSVAETLADENLSNLPLLAFRLTHALPTTPEKFRSIYKWVCDNIAYDYPTYAENEQKRKKLTGDELKAWNARLNKRVFDRLISRQETVCFGYAYLVKELATLSGIPCEIVDGYGRSSRSNIGGPGTANHSWNRVKLNGKWYVCDPTWSSGAYDMQTNSFVRKFENGYFLAEPSVFYRNHYPADTTSAQVNSKTTLRQFLDAPIIYYGAYHVNVNDLLPADFNINTTRGKTLTIQFRTDEEMRNKPVTLQIVRQGQTSQAKKETYLNAEGYNCIDHTFTAKGKHIVHAVIDGEFVFSYAVNVE